MLDGDEPISEYQKTVRDRASESLGPLRYALNSTLKTPSSTSKRLCARDEYSSAVSRLRILLQQYNKSKASTDSALPQNLDETPPGLPRLITHGLHDYLPHADELTGLLNSQFAVVQRLESQLEFYKDALESLKKRTELLIGENQTLYEQLKVQAISQILDSEQKDNSDEESKTILREASCQTFEMSTPQFRGTGSDAKRFGAGNGEYDNEGMPRYFSTDEVRHPGEPLMWLNGHDANLTTDDHDAMKSIDEQLFLSPKERKFVLQMEEEVDKIRQLHENKSRLLESLLHSTRNELEDYQRQISELQNKLRGRDVMIDQAGRPALCVKCGHKEAILSSTHSDATIKTIDKLTRERDEVMESLTSQKSTLTEVRKRELEAYMQVKKSCDMVEQAQLEKAQAIIQVHQLREELQNQRQRYDKYMTESSERTSRGQEKVKEQCEKEIDRLNSKVQSITNAHAATENQLERVTREKVALASELDQAKAQIIAHLAEISKVSEDTCKELLDMTVKHTLATQEISSLKSAAQHTNRQQEQERIRLSTELSDLRRRLEEAQAGWMESKEDCIRLTERLHQAEREAKIAVSARTNMDKTRKAEMTSVSQQAQQREQQMSALLQETESRNTQARVELEHLLESQLQVSTRLKDECKKLTKQLEDLSIKSRADVRDAIHECDKVKAQLASIATKYKTLEANSAHRQTRIDRLSTKLKQAETSIKKYVQQIYELLVKQNALMKDRQELTREMEYLRQQLLQSHKQGGVTPVDTESIASIA